ncbi:lipopolysaccharide-induced tumor necrosis factor-alpha factor-like [Hyposmocoma kahamanoa]|uniref:lipopolysaccharide-induced tumor necrosis factor-alpha factor-like n=1 Tax=Hyposmocoma kahamanoa TaxID=1477025 RepID=UPI000E6D854A|nr:lipopolysaccharide-induced tumor necrosis factor-alpha factor-like [Hyposmocoma kahamanoa]
MPQESFHLNHKENLQVKENYGTGFGPISQQTTAVVVPPPIVLLGPDNTVTTCPFCKASVKTEVRHTVTSRTHVTAILCTLACCCCCIPYCMESTKNSDHYCPSCQKYLGTYKK